MVSMHLANVRNARFSHFTKYLVDRHLHRAKYDHFPLAEIVIFEMSEFTEFASFSLAIVVVLKNCKGPTNYVLHTAVEPLERTH